MVLGTLSIYSIYTYVLFDSRKHAFIWKHVLLVIAIEYDLCAVTPLLVNIFLDRTCVNCLILVVGHELLARLHVMSMKAKDVIFGMNF